METTKDNKKLLQFLGITLFIQAVTSLIGGSMFLGPFDSNVITDNSMLSIASSVTTANISILLQMITAVVIVMLGVAMYRAAGHKNKTMGIIALSLYIFEAVLLAVSQIFIFGLVEVSQLYATNIDGNLITIGKVLFASGEFASKIAMIPFGVGAFLFYYLLLKACVIPKWLGLYGLITVPFILIGVSLMAFGVELPFVLLMPYVPFEFFTGLYILIRYRKKSVHL